MKIVFNYLVSIFTCYFVSTTIYAQDVYALWNKDSIPYYKANDLKEYEEELWGTTCVLNITNPSLTVFKAQGKNLGKAVLILPGGGYELVAMYHEGYEVAKRLAAEGITAAVLKYRLPHPKSSNEPHMVPITDTRRALYLLRTMALTYGIDKNKVGIMGFSAGSHLATVASLWETKNIWEKPNYSALIYGVTQLSLDNKKWLEESLYFRPLTQREQKQNTLLDLIDKKTPPAFLVHAYDDEVCPVSESTMYAKKLRDNGVMVETHLFARGGHGFGLGKPKDGTDQWLKLFVNWLLVNNL